ncbi:response regulator transcription factor (plasmid) [Sphingobium sp. SJ10-10]|uniref:response regulator transcription factor n=1 Tax=Sphingobium sp. SJ10-10 TaxID=3114999 RepID=UPI002E17120C|nr:response regulator transcription factor [Sphingobium sp. SJ10-10]
MDSRAGQNSMTVMIADDHAIFRAGLRLALEARAEVREVREAGNVDEVMNLDALHHPDILILDLKIPGLTIPDGIGALRRRLGNKPILMLTASSDAGDMVGCLGAGASGYVTKSSDIAVLFEAIRMVLAGGIYVPLDVVAGQGDGIGFADAPLDPARPRLTGRQAQILDFVLEGHANKEIAYRLDISEGTVKTHLAAIMRAYDVNNRVQLLRRVERSGG